CRPPSAWDRVPHPCRPGDGELRRHQRAGWAGGEAGPGGARVTPVGVRPLPPRRLADLESAAAVIATGSVGYLDAAREDQERWVSGFRSLLDGLDAPLQVLVDFVPGRGPDAPPDPGGPVALPPPDRRRASDL